MHLILVYTRQHTSAIVSRNRNMFPVLYIVSLLEVIELAYEFITSLLLSKEPKLAAVLA